MLLRQPELEKHIESWLSRAVVTVIRGRVNKRWSVIQIKGPSQRSLGKRKLQSAWQQWSNSSLLCCGLKLIFIDWSTFQGGLLLIGFLFQELRKPLSPLLETDPKVVMVLSSEH